MALEAHRHSFSTDLLTIEAHNPTPEPVIYDKKDGQWYTHEGVDVTDTQQKKGSICLSLFLLDLRYYIPGVSDY